MGPMKGFAVFEMGMGVGHDERRCAGSSAVTVFGGFD